MSEDINKAYYAVIPANVRYDENLPANAKLLYGEITALCNQKGYCWASNDYFAKLYNCGRRSVTRWLSQLKEQGYISIEVVKKEGSKEILNRYIKIVDTPIDKNGDRYSQNLHYPIDKNGYTPIDKNGEDNNTSFNTTFNNTRESKARFTPPALEDVQAYCKERGNKVDAERFVDYYASKGWLVGKSKMKDWKAAVRNWERSEKAYNQDKPTRNANEIDYSIPSIFLD